MEAGVMLYFQLMTNVWLPLAISLVVSTFVTIVVAALVLRAPIRYPVVREK
jgi:putative effector of murein hydrolase LrgA (UPF0299 family)